MIQVTAIRQGGWKPNIEGGTFLLKNAEWVLFSGSEVKKNTLRFVVSELGLEVNVDRQKCSNEVHEKNGAEHKSSAYLFWDKAEQIWHATRDQLSGVGLMNDIFPKSKLHSTSQYLRPMVKYPDPENDTTIKDLPPDQRLLLLRDYVTEQFEVYDSKDPVDVRISTGVVPFLTRAMLGLLIQKIYIHYPRNPIDNTTDALEYLNYSREHYVSVLRRAEDQHSNSSLQINASAAGGIVHRSMIEWFLERNPKVSVFVDGLKEPDLREVEMIATGFTPILVGAIGDLIESKSRCTGERSQVVQKPIPITSGLRHKVIWSPNDNRSVVIPKGRAQKVAIWG